MSDASARSTSGCLTKSIDTIDDGFHCPWVQAGRQPGHHGAKRRRVEHGRANLEPAEQFLRPLLAQTGRRQNHRALAPAALLKLRKDKRAFDGLAEADFVRDQQARGRPRTTASAGSS